MPGSWLSAMRIRIVSARSESAAVVSRIVSLPRMSRTPMRSSSASWKLCRIGSRSAASDRNQDRLRQVGKRGGRFPNRVLAEDVPDADAKQLGVLEAVQDRVEIGGS